MSPNTFRVDQREEARSRLEERKKTEWRACTVCETTKLLSEFSGRILNHLESVQVSFLTTCRTCRSPANVNYVASAKKRDPAYKRACGYWTRSKQYGKPSDLTLREIRIMLGCPCYYCGMRDSDPTIDRRDSSKGYTKTNTVACCFRCNTLKSDMPPEAWKYILPAVRHAANLGLFKGWREKIPSKKASKGT